MAKDGKTRSQEAISKSLKQVVVAPATLSEMKEQLAIFVGISNIFMGRDSLLSQGLKDFYRYINKKASVLRYKIRTDKLLPAKILFATDEEVQR